ncbi:MAG: peroxiredoxin [Leptolyngbyaceae cyanobacterium]
MAIKAGDMAPNFTLRSQTGESVTLADFRGHKAVVLYFYPMDDSPGCTIESCTFRDGFQSFQDLNAEVIGISSDSPESHKAFAAKCGLPFTLVSDSDASVRRAYGVPSTLGFLPGRVTYVIDKNGTVRHVFNSQFSPKKHVEKALVILRELK